MNIVAAVGVVLTVAGAAGYVVGVTVPYPGREFSLTALMLGVTVVAVGRSNAAGDDG